MLRERRAGQNKAASVRVWYQTTSKLAEKSALSSLRIRA
jgi:hypothetical protein